MTNNILLNTTKNLYTRRREIAVKCKSSWMKKVQPFFRTKSPQPNTWMVSGTVNSFNKKSAEDPCQSEKAIVNCMSCKLNYHKWINRDFKDFHPLRVLEIMTYQKQWQVPFHWSAWWRKFKSGSTRKRPLAFEYNRNYVVWLHMIKLPDSTSTMEMKIVLNQSRTEFQMKMLAN